MEPLPKSLFSVVCFVFFEKGFLSVFVSDSPTFKLFLELHLLLFDSIIKSFLPAPLCQPILERAVSALVKTFSKGPRFRAAVVLAALRGRRRLASEAWQQSGRPGLTCSAPALQRPLQLTQPSSGSVKTEFLGGGRLGEKTSRSRLVTLPRRSCLQLGPPPWGRPPRPRATSPVPSGRLAPSTQETPRCLKPCPRPPPLRSGSAPCALGPPQAWRCPLSLYPHLFPAARKPAESCVFSKGPPPKGAGSPLLLGISLLYSLQWSAFITLSQCPSLTRGLRDLRAMKLPGPFLLIPRRSAFFLRGFQSPVLSSLALLLFSPHPWLPCLPRCVCVVMTCHCSSAFCWHSFPYSVPSPFCTCFPLQSR